MALFHNYFVYIMTNKYKNVLYIGVTNDLERRVEEHETGKYEGFTKKYNCHFLIYYEHFTRIDHAIDREKEIKKWRREKKNKLISAFNPTWDFLNDKIHDI
ncbi:GIY-YIG nuclease family protein [Candidatus Sulfidibacterium hydrothermale]|uniref:GIY-YIG nuclease family protein n=1 Tax=Candidatus Sulfidibacterium hydrothermale TaxID=2875962 RepID=UPI0021D40545|nr:GIY-YIG nuclease family protein [Candidatus Sulfidibacterium hydrothermale]UBM62442.1 GIY-YIG nuclease family protein [Candidatus Sulfidibacterium hydrothermale]